MAEKHATSDHHPTGQRSNGIMATGFGKVQLHTTRACWWHGPPGVPVAASPCTHPYAVHAIYRQRGSDGAWSSGRDDDRVPIAPAPTGPWHSRLLSPKGPPSPASPAPLPKQHTQWRAGSCLRHPYHAPKLPPRSGGGRGKLARAPSKQCGMMGRGSGASHARTLPRAMGPAGM